MDIGPICTYAAEICVWVTISQGLSVTVIITEPKEATKNYKGSDTPNFPIHPRKVSTDKKVKQFSSYTALFKRIIAVPFAFVDYLLPIIAKYTGKQLLCT